MTKRTLIEQGDITYEEHEDGVGHWLDSRENASVPIGAVRVINGKLYNAAYVEPERVSAAFQPTRYVYNVRWALFTLPAGIRCTEDE